MDSVLPASFHNTFRSAWQIFRHELLYVFWALMEVALIAPIFMALTPWTAFWSPALTTLWLLLIMLIPFNLSRFTSVLRISLQRQQVIMVFTLLVVLIVSWRVLLYSPAAVTDLGWIAGMLEHIGRSEDPRWPRELALFVIIAFMWWRGIALAGRGVDFRDVGLRMRAGVLLAAVFVAGLAGAQLRWSVTPFVLLFLFASLVAVVLTRVEELELSRSGRSFPVGPGWLLTILVVAAAVAFATGVISGVISGDSIGTILGMFEPFWIALRFILTTLVSMLSVLLSPLLALLILLFRWLAGEFGDSAGTGFDTIQQALQSFPQVGPEEVAETTETVRRDYRQLLTGLSMLFVVLLVALTLGRLFRRSRPAAVLQRQSVNPFEGIGRSRRPGLGRRLLDRLNLFRRWRAAASIRQTYRAMCAAAAERGFPRVESQTAYEYLPTLAEAWPGMQSDARLITEAYNRAHYGELPESEEELAEIVAAWKRLESADGVIESSA